MKLNGSRSVLHLLSFFIVWNGITLLSEAKKGGGGGGTRTGGGSPPRTGVGQQAGAAQSGTRPGGSAPIGGSKPSSGRGLATGLAAGAVGGLAAGVLTAAVVHQISQGSVGGYHDGRYYYYGDRNYPGAAAGMVKCTMQVAADLKANYSDGTPVKELVYECNRATETCCANGCCPITNSGVNGISVVPERRVNLWSILIPLAVLLIVSVIICVIIFKCIKRRGRETTVQYDTSQPQVVMQDPNKQWVHQPQPYYPSSPPYAQSPPPAYGFAPGQPQAHQHYPQPLYAPQ